MDSSPRACKLDCASGCVVAGPLSSPSRSRMKAPAHMEPIRWRLASSSNDGRKSGAASAAGIPSLPLTNNTASALLASQSGPCTETGRPRADRTKALEPNIRTCQSSVLRPKMSHIRNRSISVNWSKATRTIFFKASSMKSAGMQNATAIFAGVRSVLIGYAPYTVCMVLNRERNDR